MKKPTEANTRQTPAGVLRLTTGQVVESELRKLNSIDDVIDILEDIIQESERNHDPLGYFAVLYQKVTKKVKEGIENDFFDNGPRMEQLDIVFAERYLNAYFAYRQGQPLSASWKRAFELSTTYGSAVLQHLLVGINAHINLDLGIAAAEISKDGNIDDLEDDFVKINEILASLVDEVQNGLTGIWPFLKAILKRIGRTDNLLIEFILRSARAAAWKFARRIVHKSCDEIQARIAMRDRQTARIATIIGHPCAMLETIFGTVTLSRVTSVPERIRVLRA
ncbi:MAG: hypothetical protein EP344_01545 [Bacteroidetes bacterium]|nr:MAG: hypothetical protein EP344_01545 [Bacteroidota bacterium]